METMSMLARAKINLLLSVLDRREDGYHNIESLMQSLDFGDTVSVTRKREPGIGLTTNLSGLPVDETNIAYRAAHLMQERFGLSYGFSIHLEKRIPVAAGLAGGSTNAAAVLKLINNLCDLRLSVDELAEIGLSLGADVPFCLYERPALAEGIGERLTPAPGLKDCLIVLVNPGVGVSTAQIYKDLDSTSQQPMGNVAVLLENLEQGNLPQAFRQMNNMMESAAKKHCPAISDLIQKLYIAGADHAMMSGSGATCFGIFMNRPTETELKKIFASHLIAVTTPMI